MINCKGKFFFFHFSFYESGGEGGGRMQVVEGNSWFPGRKERSAAGSDRLTWLQQCDAKKKNLNK